MVRLGDATVTQPDGNSNGGGSGSGGGARTFTQAELDHQISERLRREREKFADYGDLKRQADEARGQQSKIDQLIAKMTEVQERAEKAELANLRRDVADGMKLPSFLRGSLTATTKDDLERQAREMVEGLKSMGVDVAAAGQNGSGGSESGGGDSGAGGGSGDGQAAGSGQNGGSGNGSGGNGGNAGQGNAGGDGAAGGSGNGSGTGGNGARGGRPREDLRSGANPGGDGSDKVDAKSVADQVLSNRMF